MAFEVAVLVFVYVGVPPARHSVVLNVWRHRVDALHICSGQRFFREFELQPAFSWREQLAAQFARSTTGDEWASRSANPPIARLPLPRRSWHRAIAAWPVVAGDAGRSELGAKKRCAFLRGVEVLPCRRPFDSRCAVVGASSSYI